MQCPLGQLPSCTQILPGEGSLPDFSPLHIPRLHNLLAPKIPQPGVSGLGKEVELNTWQMCSGSRGFHSFADLQFPWQSHSLQVLWLVPIPSHYEVWRSANLTLSIWPSSASLPVSEAQELQKIEYNGISGWWQEKPVTGEFISGGDRQW